MTPNTNTKESTMEGDTPPDAWWNNATRLGLMRHEARGEIAERAGDWPWTDDELDRIIDLLIERGLMHHDHESGYWLGDCTDDAFYSTVEEACEATR